VNTPVEPLLTPLLELGPDDVETGAADSSGTVSAPPQPASSNASNPAIGKSLFIFMESTSTAYYSSIS
jgi:hypothetical protein